jgi:RNA-directed DNA polymerase
MNLRSDKRQNVQGQLDFSFPPAGKAREAKREETESPVAEHDPESPASTNRLMEEICERENLKQALQQVKANKGSAGVDGMTVGGITDYLKQHWPVIRGGDDRGSDEGTSRCRRSAFGATRLRG